MAIKKLSKAQVALEFLTTYGWAFLVILIMIGTLAYFGILSPSKLLPNRCNFGTEFQCMDYKIKATATNEFRVKLKNNVGEPVTVSAISLTTEAVTAISGCTNPTNPSNWKSGDFQELVWSGCTDFGGFVSGEKSKVLIQIDWYTVASGSNYGKITKGEVFSTVT